MKQKARKVVRGSPGHTQKPAPREVSPLRREIAATRRLRIALLARAARNRTLPADFSDLFGLLAAGGLAEE